jgi:hypothetical protein
MEVPASARRLTDLPPRNIDRFTKATVLFGGFFQQFGWIFFSVGSLFAWIFIPASEVRYWFESEKNWREISGKILTAESTNSSVNDEIVYSYFYAFEWQGKRFTGKSYTPGLRFQSGEVVTIRFSDKNPSKSYMEGAERAVFPAFVLIVLIFPLVGAGFIIHSFLQNIKTIRLLEIGEFTQGRLLSKEATNGEVKINGRRYPIFKYLFEFEADGIKHTSACKTHRGWLVEDEAQEIILYDRYNPHDNLVFDAAPNVPDITEDGRLGQAPVSQVIYLILPHIGVGINLFFLWK